MKVPVLIVSFELAIVKPHMSGIVRRLDIRSLNSVPSVVHPFMSGSFYSQHFFLTMSISGPLRTSNCIELTKISTFNKN